MRDTFSLCPVVTVGMQIRALEAVLRRVAEADSAGLRPVVEIDLDLTALRPRLRTMNALRVAADRYPVPELADPTRLPVLPGYTAEAWDSFLAQSQLPRMYPHFAWRGSNQRGAEPSIYGVFHAAYWTTAWLIEDEPTPGLGEFVRRVEDRGGSVAFLSGRWLDEQVPPSREALRRAGISEPVLLIGNPRHAENVHPGEKADSDAEVKQKRQTEILANLGTPVAVFDDRAANRDAVITAVAACPECAGRPPVLGIGIAIPGFSHDAATASAPLRVSTFEGLMTRGADPRREPFLFARYPRPADGSPYRGLLTGLGRNGKGYVLPRVVDPAADGWELPGNLSAPFAVLVASHPPRSLAVDTFMKAVEEIIPDDILRQLERALTGAEEQARLGLASPFPESPEERKSLWHTLACSWLHSRDLEVMMTVFGYPLQATGIHDMSEEVPVGDLVAAVGRARDEGMPYSPWFLRWVDSVKNQDRVHVDFLNPNLTVGTWRWRPDQDMPQDAMDAHRLSAHHEGDGQDRYDPIEATVNNLLHAREGVYGVQKGPVMGWDQLFSHAGSRAAGEELAKSTWGGRLLGDAVVLLRRLEARGAVMPWELVK
jgi:hypothetical protein